MGDIRITDLVAPKAFEQLKELQAELTKTKETFLSVIKELGDVVKTKATSLEDVEKINQRTQAAYARAEEATRKLAEAQQRQQAIVGQTTNAISKELAEIEKANKAMRDSYTIDKTALDMAKSIIGTREQNIERLSKLQAQLKSVTASQKELDEAMKSGKVSEQAAILAGVPLIDQQRQLKDSIRELNLVLNNQDKELNAAEGSYRQLSLQLEQMKMAYKSLNEEEKNSDIGKTLSDEAERLNRHLIDTGASLGEFQRNVGNYAIANGGMKKELRGMIEELALLTIQYRNLSEAERESAQGKELEAKISETTEKAAVLKDAIGDVNRSIKESADDASSFKAVSEGIQLVVNGFGSAKAAASIFGLEEEDLVAVQTKLQSVLVMSNALQATQNALQKESSLMLGVRRIQELAAARAIAIRNATEKSGVIVTKAATVAQAAFNAVANANPYVLLATGIGLLIAALVAFTPKQKSATEATKESLDATRDATQAAKERAEAEAQLAEKVSQSASGQIAAFLKLQRKWKECGDDLSKQRQFMEDYKDEVKQTGFSVNDLTDAENLFVKNSDNVIKSIMLRARAQANYEIAVEKLKKGLQDLETKSVKTGDYYTNASYENLTQQERDALSKRFGNKWSVSEEKTTVMPNYGTATGAAAAASWSNPIHYKLTDEAKQYINDMRRDEAKELHKSYVSHVEKQMNEDAEHFIGNYEKLMDEANNIVSGNGLKLAGGDPGSGKGQTHVVDKVSEAKNLEEVRDIVLKAERETLKDKLSIVEKGSEEALSVRKQLAEVERDIELSASKKNFDEQLTKLEESLKQKTVTQEDYNKAVETFTNQRTQAELLAEDTKDKAIKQAQEDFANAEIERISERASTEQALRDRWLVEEQTATAERYAQGIIDKEEYERTLVELENAYTVKTVEATIATLEEELSVEALTDEKRAEIAKELADAKADFAKKVADISVSEMEREMDEERRLSEERQKNLKKWAQVASQAIGRVGKLMGALYDGQLQKIDEEKEANQAHYDEEVERIDSLAERGAISTEEAEARKTAAEKRHAEKEEELERKKTDIAYKKAVWEKATSVAEASIATAVAITEALKTGPWMAAIVAAMGAIQVATILATPIKAYAKGTPKEGHQGGLAVVGDGGKREIIMFGEKVWVTPDTPTLVDLPKGAGVYPDANDMPEVPLPLSNSPAMPETVVVSDFSELEKKLDKVANKQIKNAKEMTWAMIREQRRASYEAEFDKYRKSNL